MKKQQITCESARNFSCLEALRNLGHFPVRKTEKEAWFLSPLRSETQASFKVSLTLNRWYDHGAGIGGNVIDLVCLINQCSVKEALAILDRENISFSFRQPAFPGKDHGIAIIQTKRIDHPALHQYLRSRGITYQTAHHYCDEVHYTLNGKRYFAIGLKNISGGYELRNKFYKNSSSPKDITLIKHDQTNLIICEGLFDMLSLLSYNPSLREKADVLVLNSISFARKIEKHLQSYTCIELYLDRDATGIKTTEFLLKQNPKCIDMSLLYKGFTDVNEWWVTQQQLSG
ncbi:toprim domain-containing protein [Sinomicrobium weinanense]|uniref:Toprim domain-containing protein n=1 Tax=Sinomicrobium weinanense TaxID=2842200 RepID=A0A926JRQ1_9FLAO|nr:toprim domain-containing protein [Sinomicrobium weinanense]MBC9796277.1 toprim domain-containing protein [Sinomicrobium weinanense]MBU3123242.1 toprim domain-containing protein [Sinomicrobium weinanense]